MVLCFWSRKFRCLPQGVKMQKKNFCNWQHLLEVQCIFFFSVLSVSILRFEELSQSLHIFMLVLKSILPWDVHNNGRHDNTIKANKIQPTPWVGARMRRTQMRQNQQLSQALIHRLTRIHPPVKPAGKASTTHMYTSKTYLTWPDLTVGRDVINPPHPPPPEKTWQGKQQAPLPKHVLHSLILQSAGTLLPPHPPPTPCNLARQTTTTTNNAHVHFGNMSYIAWSYSRQGRYYPPTPTPPGATWQGKQQAPPTTHFYTSETCLT